MTALDDFDGVEVSSVGVQVSVSGSVARYKFPETHYPFCGTDDLSVRSGDYVHREIYPFKHNFRGWSQVVHITDSVLITKFIDADRDDAVDRYDVVEHSQLASELQDTFSTTSLSSERPSTESVSPGLSE